MDPVPDLLRDFAFAKLAEPLDATANSVVVDDVSDLPTTAELNAAFGQFWMTIESPLSHPHSFEIVRVTAVDAATKTLTLTRGERSASTTHAAGAYIKGTVSAAMLRKIADGLGGPNFPPSSVTSSGLYGEGQLYYHTGEHRWYFLSDVPGAVWTVLGSGAGSAVPDLDVSFQWFSLEDLQVQDYDTGTPVTGPLGAGHYDVFPRRRLLGASHLDLYPDLVQPLFQLAQGVDAIWDPSMSIDLSGLSSGDRVDLEFNGGTPATYYADASGQVFARATSSIMRSYSNSESSFNFTLRLTTAATDVTVDNVYYDFVMINGTPTGQPAPVTNPDDMPTGATTVDVTTDSPSWATDDYLSLGDPAATPPAGHQPVYNARWFTFTPAADTELTFTVTSDDGSGVGMLLYDSEPNTSTPVHMDAAGTGTASMNVINLYEGVQYWLAVGTQKLNPAAEATLSLTFAPYGTPATVVGHEVLNTGTGGMPASLTVPAGTGLVLIFVGVTGGAEGSGAAPALTLNGAGITNYGMVVDQHNVGSPSYGLASYAWETPTTGVATIDYSGTDTLTGAVAIYLTGIVWGGITAFPTLNPNGTSISASNFANDLELMAVNVAVAATISDGTEIATAGNLVTAYAPHVSNAASTVAFTWAGDQNGASGAMTIRGPA